MGLWSLAETHGRCGYGTSTLSDALPNCPQAVIAILSSPHSTHTKQVLYTGAENWVDLIELVEVYVTHCGSYSLTVSCTLCPYFHLWH